MGRDHVQGAMAENKLWRADFRETLSRVAAMGGADLIFTSPPYHDARTAGAYGVTDAWAVQDDRDLGDAVFAALKPGGHCLLVVDAPVRSWRPGHATERGLQPWRLLLDWADRVGLTVRDRLAYLRQGATGAYGGRFRNDWEPMFWFQRPGALGHFDKSSLSTTSKHPTRWKSGNTASGRQANGEMYRRGASGEAVEQGLTRRGTAWEYGSVGKGCSGCPALEETDHPARLPLRLALDAVACMSPPHGLVVDPFLGSGTTLVACLRLGRAFAGGDSGCDLSGTPWVNVASQIAAAETAQTSLVDPHGEWLSAERDRGDNP